VATDLHAIEQGILKRLEPLTAKHSFSLGLLDAAELKRPQQAKRVVISYQGSDFTVPTTFNGGQLRTIRYEVRSQFLELRTHDTAYPLLGDIRDLLSNWEPVAGLTTKPMQIKKETFASKAEDIEAGSWQYSQVYEFQVMEV
jgi:hypothetical protein